MAGIDIERLVDLSGAVTLDDLDWELCRKVGISDSEERILKYLGDTETHTILYMRDLLAGHSARDHEITSFLSVWVYEELWHGRAISRLLVEAGRPEEPDRYRKVTEQASFREVAEAFLSQGAAHLTPRFIAAHMTWGAINELTAAAAYNAIIESTENPVLAELLRRIVKQERKHFSFYFDQAMQRLESDKMTQALTRFTIKRFWTVVGSGVGGADNLGYIAALHFETPEKREPLLEVERRIQQLPGMEWFNILHTQVARLADSYVAKHGLVAA